MAATEATPAVVEIVETPEVVVEESGGRLLRGVLMAIGVAAIIAAVATVVVRRRG